MTDTLPDPLTLFKTHIADMVGEVQMRMAPRAIAWKEHKTKIDQLLIIPFSFNNGDKPLTHQEVIPLLKRFLPGVTEDDLKEIETLIGQKDVMRSYLTNAVAEWYVDREWGLTFRSDGCAVSFNTISRKKIEQQENHRKKRFSRR